MMDNIESVIENAEVVIIGNLSTEFSKLEDKASNGRIVIDLVRVFDGRVSDSLYQGICW
jgi:hypothetical protein